MADCAQKPPSRQLSKHDKYNSKCVCDVCTCGSMELIQDCINALEGSPSGQSSKLRPQTRPSSTRSRFRPGLCTSSRKLL